MEEKVCCICKKIFCGYGNNAYPLYDDGICCYECNLEYVIPARLQQISKGDKNNETKTK